MGAGGVQGSSRLDSKEEGRLKGCGAAEGTLEWRGNSGIPVKFQSNSGLASKGYLLSMWYTGLQDASSARSVVDVDWGVAVVDCRGSQSLSLAL